MVSFALIFQRVRNPLELGQVNALMFILLAVFFALYRGGRDVPAGLVLGLSIAIRLHPAMLVLYLMWRREFRTAGFGFGDGGGGGGVARPHLFSGPRQSAFFSS